MTRTRYHRGVHKGIRLHIVASALLSATLLAPSTAFSRGEENTLTLLTGGNPDGSFSLRPIQIRLEEDDIEDLDVTAWISQRGHVLTLKEQFGHSFLPASSAGQSLLEGLSVGKKGTVVDFGTPHQLSLPDGVYVEHVSMTLSFRSHGRRTWTQKDTRYFRVTGGQVKYIDSTEYSHEADPEERDFDSAGNAVQAYRGVGDAKQIRTKAPPRPDQLDQSTHSGDTGQQPGDVSETNED